MQAEVRLGLEGTTLRRFFFLPALIVCSAPAFANVTVSFPFSGARVASPFGLAASASPCDSQSIVAIGYSLDNSSYTAIFRGASLNTSVSSGTGSHVVHVKSWGSSGAVCVANMSVTVVPPATSAVPSNAYVSRAIQTLSNWQAATDLATGGGGSWGLMQLVSAPSLSGTAREFQTTFSNSSGERYDVSFGADITATNFLYDGWVYFAGSLNTVANLEMDMNQVTANGQTVIFGVQCDGYSGTWDYTVNAGSPWAPKDQWWHTAAHCNPREWGTNSWHHIQILYSRDNSGNVTYHSIWLDNIENPVNATVPSSFALGWGTTLLTNFQVDGIGASGTNTVYLDNLTISRW
ncbi:MAG TPA: hypothetical protein VKR52_13120 [Terracidiphilus sp.]|nr:hypothetical protein [Terracidiphilus sp.]